MRRIGRTIGAAAVLILVLVFAPSDGAANSHAGDDPPDPEAEVDGGDGTTGGDAALLTFPDVTYQFAATGPSSTVDAEVGRADGVEVVGISRLRVQFGDRIVAGIEDRFHLAEDLNDDSELTITADLELDGDRLASGAYEIAVAFAVTKDGDPVADPVVHAFSLDVPDAPFASAEFTGKYQLDATKSTVTVDAAIELRDTVPAENVSVAGFTVTSGDAPTVVLTAVKSRFDVGAPTGSGDDALLPVTVDLGPAAGDRLATGDYQLHVDLARTDVEETAEVEITLSLGEPIALIELDDEDASFDLGVDGARRTTRVPVDVRTGVDPARLEMSVHRVLEAGSEDARFKPFFAASGLVGARDAQALCIVTTFARAEGDPLVLEPGTYTVEVEVDLTAPLDGEAVPSTQDEDCPEPPVEAESGDQEEGESGDREIVDTALLNVRLVVPNAALAASPNILVEREEEFEFLGMFALPWVGGDEDSAAGVLVLREQDNRSRITNLTTFSDLTFDEAPFTKADLSIETAGTVVPRGGRVDVAVHADGDFPLGTVTGSVTVEAPQLTADGTAEVTVKSVRSTALIVWIVLFGVAAALFVRSFLESLIKWSKGRRNLGLSIDALDEKIAAAKDPSYRTAVVGARARLQKAKATKKLWLRYDFSTVIGESKAELDAAEASLTNRTRAVRADLEDLAALCPAPGTLPVQIDRLIERPFVLQATDEPPPSGEGDPSNVPVSPPMTPCAHLAKVRRTFNTGDITRAANQVAMIRQHLKAEGLEGAVDAWRDTTKENLAGLGSGAAVPAEFRNDLTQHRAAALTALDAVRSDDVSVSAMMDGIIAARQAVGDVLVDGVTPVQVRLREVLRELDDAPEQTEVQVFARAVSSLTEALLEGVADPDSGLARAGAVGGVPAFKVALEEAADALEAQAAAVPESQRALYWALIAESRYLDAARMVEPAPPGQDDADAPGGEFAPMTAQGDDQTTQSKSRESTPTVALVEPQDAAPVEVILPAVPRPNLRFAYWAARFLQAAAVIAVLLIIAIGWFEDSWVGDVKDMTAVFLWAFTIDLGVDTLTKGTIADKLAAKPGSDLP